MIAKYHIKDILDVYAVSSTKSTFAFLMNSDEQEVIFDCKDPRLEKRGLEWVEAHRNMWVSNMLHLLQCNPEDLRRTQLSSQAAIAAMPKAPAIYGCDKCKFRCQTQHSLWIHQNSGKCPRVSEDLDNERKAEIHSIAEKELKLAKERSVERLRKLKHNKTQNK